MADSEKEPQQNQPTITEEEQPPKEVIVENNKLVPMTENRSELDTSAITDVTEEEMKMFTSYGDVSELNTLQLTALQQVAKLKKFAMIDSFVEAKQFIESESTLASPESLHFLKNWCIKLQRQKQNEKVYYVAKQTVCLQEINSFVSANNFFQKLNSDWCYYALFCEKVYQFRKNVELEAAALEIMEEEKQLETFVLTDFCDLKQFLLNNLKLVNEKTERCLKDRCSKLCKEGKKDEVGKAAFQYICIKQILTETNEDQSRRVEAFFDRLFGFEADLQVLALKRMSDDFIDKMKTDVAQPQYCKWFFRRFTLLIIELLMAMVIVWAIFSFSR